MPEPIYRVERQLSPGPGRPDAAAVFIDCEAKEHGITEVWVRTPTGVALLDRDEIYRLVDVVAVADPTEWARRFPPEQPEPQQPPRFDRKRRPAWSRLDHVEQRLHLRDEHAVARLPVRPGSDRDWLHLEAHQTTAVNHWHEDVDPDA